MPAFTAGTPLSAAALNDAVGYTTPTTFTTTTPAGAGWYRKVGSLVEVHYESTGNVSADAEVTPYTFPVGYRPAGRVALAACAGAASTRSAVAAVNADGTLNVRNAFTSATVVQCHGLYAPA